MQKKTSDQRPSPAAPPHLCDRSGPPAPTARGTGHAAGAEWWRCRLPPVAGLRLLWLWVKSCQKSIDQMDPNRSNGLRLIHLQKKDLSWKLIENSLKNDKRVEMRKGEAVSSLGCLLIPWNYLEPHHVVQCICGSGDIIEVSKLEVPTICKVYGRYMWGMSKIYQNMALDGTYGTVAQVWVPEMGIGTSSH